MKYLDLDGNNKIEQTVSANDIKDQRIIGNSLPRYTYSIRLNAEWNGIDFSVFFQGVGKQDWYPSSDAFAFGDRIVHQHQVSFRRIFGRRMERRQS